MRSVPKEVDLGKDPGGRLLVTLAAPAITSQVVNALYNVVDRMYIGHIPENGAAALTGLGVCFPLIMLISAFANLIGMGGAPRASILMGHGDEKAAERILGNCFATLVALAVALTAFSFAFMRPMLMLFGASEATIGYAVDYMEHARHERLHNGAGLFKNQHDDRRHRRGHEHRARPYFYLRPRHGRARSRVGDGHIAGRQRGVGRALSLRRPHRSETAAREHEDIPRRADAVRRARPLLQRLDHATGKTTGAADVVVGRDRDAIALQAVDVERASVIDDVHGEMPRDIIGARKDALADRRDVGLDERLLLEGGRGQAQLDIPQGAHRLDGVIALAQRDPAGGLECKAHEHRVVVDTKLDVEDLPLIGRRKLATACRHTRGALRERIGFRLP